MSVECFLAILNLAEALIDGPPLTPKPDDPAIRRKPKLKLNLPDE